MELLLWNGYRVGLGRRRIAWITGVCVLVLAGGLVSPPAWADDDDKSHRPDPAARLEKMSKTLSLTEAQQAKIRPILEEKAKKIQSLHEQMKALRLEARAKIEAELTEDQKAKFREMREKYQKKKKDRHGKHGKNSDRHSNDHD